MIYIANKKRKLDRIQKQYPGAVILDLTSTSPMRYGQLLSPFFPHGNIPIPFSEGATGASVEGIWQGLKVFEDADVDFRTINNVSMQHIKRTVSKHGKPLGHRKGLYNDDLLDYHDARFLIYIPTYKWVLDNVPSVHNIVERIKHQSMLQDIVFLDYNINEDWNDMTKPLSHAALVKAYIEDRYPDGQSKSSKTPIYTQPSLFENFT